MFAALLPQLDVTFVLLFFGLIVLVFVGLPLTIGLLYYRWRNRKTLSWQLSLVSSL